MPVTEANGVSKAINLATNISALVVFLINGKVIFAVGLVAGLFSIAGNWLGSSFFQKRRQQGRKADNDMRPRHILRESAQRGHRMKNV